jgi:hypothetical protein
MFLQFAHVSGHSLSLNELQIKIPKWYAGGVGGPKNLLIFKTSARDRHH